MPICGPVEMMGFRLSWNLKRSTLKLDRVSGYNHLALTTSQIVPVKLWRNLGPKVPLASHVLAPEKIIRCGERTWALSPNEHLMAEAGGRKLYLLLITEKTDLFIWAPSEGDWWAAIQFGISPPEATALEYGKALQLATVKTPLIMECPHCADAVDSHDTEPGRYFEHSSAMS
jgi:hypothetical protein